MILFSISDIRLFWTNDARFRSQFAAAKGITTYKPWSVYPEVKMDMSFWLPAEPREPWEENDYCDLVRDVAGDKAELVEKVRSHGGLLRRQPPSPLISLLLPSHPARRLHPPQDGPPVAHVPDHVPLDGAYADERRGCRHAQAHRRALPRQLWCRDPIAWRSHGSLEKETFMSWCGRGWVQGASQEGSDGLRRSHRIGDQASRGLGKMAGMSHLWWGRLSVSTPWPPQ
jgi:hypothetical protein